MPKYKDAQPVSGWIILNKEIGMSSAFAVGRIRRLFNGVKAGHAGTLDPLASGVLPVALGEATKTVNYVMTTEKNYRFSVLWGAETQTDDREGQITRTSDKIPTQAEIEQNLGAFTGRILQTPPDYSAVKVGGKRAYALARKRDNHKSDDTASPVLTPRPVVIHAFRLLSCDQKGATFHVHCGKGAYIRALARDLGRKCGSAAHVTVLERLSVGQFSTENAISLDILTQLADSGAAHEALVDVKTVLDDIPALALTEDQAKKLRFGQDIEWSAPLPDSTVMLACFKDTPVAMVSVVSSKVSPQRVFNL